MGDRLDSLNVNEVKKRRRERIAILITFICLILLTFTEYHLSKTSTSLPFVNSIFFFGLLNINIILLLLLVWLISRNLGKVFIERRRRILGSKLKSKLIAAFLAFSLIPTITLFIISSAYINSSFDKWFSLKIQNTLEASLEITRSYYKNTDETAHHFARHIVKGLVGKLPKNLDSLMVERIPESIAQYLEEQRELLALDAVEFYFDPLDERILVVRPESPLSKESIPRFSLDVLDKGFQGEKISRVQSLGLGDLLRAMIPVRLNTKPDAPVVGVVVVNTFIPVSLNERVDEIASVFDDYKDTNPLRYPIKTAYTLILVMITLLIVFVAVWVGLYLARELTTPIERLVLAAQQVGSGNLDVEIHAAGQDELTVLVRSFNQMIADLKESRSRLTLASADLERRTRQLEAVLGSVRSGVLSVDGNGKITTCNPMASELLGVAAPQILGKNFKSVLSERAPTLSEIIECSLSDRDYENPVQSLQFNYRVGSKVQNLMASVTLLHENWGVVVTIDDFTHLVKAQREFAWREVARRIAHEIKNPLTPIKLSAQRLQRRMKNYSDNEARILQECTEMIIKHTDELKELVNEFSNFARFPEISPAPHDLNLAIQEVVNLFRQAHPEVRVDYQPDKKTPIFEFDRDQMKRVILNLFDNAVAAMRDSKGEVASDAKIEVITHYNDDLKMVAILFRDNGAGMTEEVKERLFEPYFSTKKEGTGLGLAIVKRIVNDHDGFIRVHSAPGEGTEFLIELPTAIRQKKET
jgi:two-component system nitrogen regulation sensor histidine kinase NtrY